MATGISTGAGITIAAFQLFLVAVAEAGSTQSLTAKSTKHLGIKLDINIGKAWMDFLVILHFVRRLSYSLSLN